MNHIKLNRRSLLRSGLFAGALAACPSQVFAMSRTDLEEYAKDTVLREFPKAASRPDLVSAFAKRIAGDEFHNLEEKGFVSEASRSFDSFALDRFIVMEFSTQVEHLDLI